MSCNVPVFNSTLPALNTEYRGDGVGMAVVKVCRKGRGSRQRLKHKVKQYQRGDSNCKLVTSTLPPHPPLTPTSTYCLFIP